MNGRRLRSFLAAALAALALAATAAAETFTLELGAGWNLVSFPRRLPDTAVGAALAPVAGKYSSVWACQGGAWKFYDPARPELSDLWEVDAGWGYWVYMLEAASLAVGDAGPQADVQLAPGWNLVGYNSAAPRAIGEALSGAAGKYLSAWSYWAGAWLFYDPAQPGMSDLATMDPGYGYWVDAGESFTWPLPDEVDPVVGNLRYVPAGAFTQGSPAGEPCRYSNETQFTHTLTKGMAVMETEVTRQMWADLKAYWDGQPGPGDKLPADPTYTFYGAGMSNPVQSVTWYEAVLFANLLSLRRGLAPCYYADAGFTTPIDAANYTAGPFYCDWDAGVPARLHGNLSPPGKIHA